MELRPKDLGGKLAHFVVEENVTVVDDIVAVAEEFGADRTEQVRPSHQASDDRGVRDFGRHLGAQRTDGPHDVLRDWYG